MYRILIVRPERPAVKATLDPVVSALVAAGQTVASVDADAPLTVLSEVFHGLPPTIVLMDLTTASDALPLGHLKRQVQEIWQDAPLLYLVILNPRQLAQRDWLPLCDDFLVSPILPEEMEARIRFLSFRRRHIEGTDTLRYQDIVLNITRSEAQRENGKPIALTPREYDLLCFLVTHRGRLFSRERLLDLVWGVDYTGGPRTVDIHIRRLRMKLPPVAAGLLENRRGVGYGFRASAKE